MSQREALERLQYWCDQQAYGLGAVDGYDYRSGEEAAYRHTSIEIGKLLAALSPQAGAEVVASDAWSAAKHDEIIERLMAGIGWPNSRSIYQAFKQFANELHALAAHPPASALPGREVKFVYVNYRGEESLRRAVPISIRYGKSLYHDTQWLMLALDLDKNEEREFAMRDMTWISPTDAILALLSRAPSDGAKGSDGGVEAYGHAASCNVPAGVTSGSAAVASGPSDTKPPSDALTEWMMDRAAHGDIGICMACALPIVEGDEFYPDHGNGGEMHAACCGPERESYTDAGGNPLVEDAPIPKPSIWRNPSSDDGWRDISSAPKDGARIIIAGGTGIDSGSMGSFPLVGWTLAYLADEYLEYPFRGENSGTCDEFYYWKPTHWLPESFVPALPAPPIKGAHDGE